jgi:hypothetical protein
MDLTKPLILMFSFSDVHNITQLLGCVLCDHLLGKHDFPSIPEFLTDGGAPTLYTVEFSTSNHIYIKKINYNLLLWK